MKNLFFVFLFAFTIMSFNTTQETEVNSEFTSSIQVENLDNEDRPCRWRTCTYRNGVLVGCTEWTYGECLDEVVITAKR
ncbi:hypothetical protein [Tenacibaculum sp. 190524A05c]|uniref:hypothetical protein n=1 Tax=Tenacibaculum platacis TaxID=3137852 RepID=UPI0032B2B3A9